jgi:hypothetical protein
MRDLKGSAQGEAAAAIDVCFARLAEIDAYPSWYPTGVKEAQPLEHGPGGEVTKVKATLAVTQGPIQRDFTLHLAVRLEHPHLVELRRLPRSSDDKDQMVITWRLRELAAETTHVAIDLAASLDIPRFLPIGSLADGIANGFLAAALAALA